MFPISIDHSSPTTIGKIVLEFETVTRITKVGNGGVPFRPRYREHSDARAYRWRESRVYFLSNEALRAKGK